jgi:putative ABC transport system permease protein
MFIKIGSENLASTLLEINYVWKKFEPSKPMELAFQDQVIETLYKSEINLQHLFLVLTVIAILIGCIGMFALASLSAVQRTKEIAVRKVLGASVRGLVTLLSTEFMLLIGVAFLVASPVAWCFMHEWLQSFAYKINITVWTFLLSGAAAVLLTVLSVGYQALKVAMSNPANNLRTE